MSSRSLRGPVAALMIGAAAVATAGPATDEADLTRLVGQRVEDFALTDATTGQPVRLHDFEGKSAAVLVFTGVGCPIGDLYMPRLVDLEKRYRDRGVVFLAIDSNVLREPAALADQAKQFNLPFPILIDDGHKVADALAAERTCEALVLDAKAHLRYRGAIDDQYGIGAAREAPKQNFLADAIDAVLAGRTPETAGTSVVGCPIERDRPSAEVDRAQLAALPVEARVTALVGAAQRVRSASEELLKAWEEVEGDEAIEVGAVNYAEHVAPILQAKCQTCHRPGQVAPFPLLGYDDARRRASAIAEAVDLRRMPPWHADPRHGRFENDRSLTPRDRATLLAWVEQDAPRGNPADEPAPKAWPEGWTIGEPDAVIEMAETYTVKSEGVEPYRWFRVPSGFTEDKWIEAAEARPGDPTVVHHILVFAVPPGTKARPDFRRGHLVGYAPGDIPSVYPAGTAKKIAAGSDLIFQMHYTPNGKVRIDRSKVGFRFARGPIDREALTLAIPQGRLEIPPHDPDYRADSKFNFPRDAQLLGFLPHMHLRGKDFQYTATYADGTSETLLSVPAFDFGWQSYYRLAKPLAFRKGEQIDCRAHFDNSAANPVNPDPTATVRWGDQTWEEMMIGYVDISFPIDAAGADGDD